MIAGYYRRFEAYKGTQFVFSDLGTYKPGAGGTSIPEIRRKLAEDYGIPQSEVRFIQEATSEKARKEMIAGMNTGKNPRTLRIDRDARDGSERAETLRGDTPPGLPLASQRPGAARRAGNTHRERDRQTPCRQQGGRDIIRRREVARRLQVRAVAQQATVHPPAQDQQHGKPYHRRGGHRRKRAA